MLASDDEETKESLTPELDPKDEELVAYILELLEMINTEDEKLNQENMNLLVDQISVKLEEMSGKKQDKAAVRKFLEELRNNQLSEAKTAEERKAMLQKMTEGFYNLGYIGLYASS